MTDISKASIEELQAEILKREKSAIPKPLENPDFLKIKEEAISIIEHIIEHNESPKDAEQYLYENVLTTIYGEDIFDYINSQS